MPPKQRWIDRGEDFKLLGLRDGKQMANDRKTWIGVVGATMVLQGLE